jgi:hypothetical protein
MSPETVALPVPTILTLYVVTIVPPTFPPVYCTGPMHERYDGLVGVLSHPQASA